MGREVIGARRPFLERGSALFVAAVCFAGCARGLDPAMTLTVAIDSGPSSLDPRLGSDEASKGVNQLLYNGLFRVDESARPVPDLAAAVERPDDRTLIVTLRDDVRFQDGTRLEPRDVVATYRSILEDEVPSLRRGHLSAVASVDENGERSVRFRLKAPFAPLLINLAMPILKAGAGPEAARHPIGTGPFRLVRYRKDEDLLLERFEGYFGGPASVHYVHLKIIPSETGRLLELLKGSVDLIVNDLSPDQLARVGIDLEIRTYEWPTFYDDLKAGRFQIAVSNWTEIADPDIYRLRFHSRAQPPDGFNRGGYASAVVDRLIEEGATTLDEGARRRIYGEIQRRLAHDLPDVSLWHRDVFVVRRDRVGHFRLTPGADFTPFREITLGPPANVDRSAQPAAENPFDLLDRNPAGPDQPGGVDAAIDDGRWKGPACRFTVKDQNDFHPL